jgi:hypothetical protein
LLPAVASKSPGQHCIQQQQAEQHGESVLQLLCEEADEGSNNSKQGLLRSLQPHAPVTATGSSGRHTPGRHHQRLYAEHLVR